MKTTIDSDGVVYCYFYFFVETKMPKKQIAESIIAEAKVQGVVLNCDIHDLLRLSYRQLCTLYDEVAEV